MKAKNVAYPFRTIPENLIEGTPWVQLEAGGVMPSLNKIDHWDYDTEITLERTISFDVERCLRSIGLGEDAKLLLIVMVITGPTGSRWIAFQQNIENSQKNFSNISFVLNSEKLAGAITLITEVILMAPGSNSENLSASKPGSRLWSESHQIDIEGISARFPMDILDFDKALKSLDISSALWYLQWNPEHLESSFVGNVVLYLNIKQKNFIEKVKSEDSVVIQWIKLDLIRQMCSVAIEQNEFVENYHGYQDGSIGGTIRDWISLAFDNMSVEVVRAMYVNQRPRFESMILSVFGSDDV